MKRKSRYHDTSLFAPDPRGNSDFIGVRPREISHAPGVLEHLVTSGARLDRLGDNYFNNNRLWYRLGDTNWGFLFAPDMILDMPDQKDDEVDPLSRTDRVGHTILIPKARE